MNFEYAADLVGNQVLRFYFIFSFFPEFLADKAIDYFFQTKLTEVPNKIIRNGERTEKVSRQTCFN